MRYFNDSSGATAIEYALILALVFIGAVAGFFALGDASTGMWGGLDNKVSPALESGS
jgi:pilus assembly protein Flp/PilA